MDIQYPEDIIGRGNQVMKQMQKSLLPIIAIVVLLALAATGIYQIPPDSVGVITRFGGYVRQTGPGLHFKLPLFIERVYTVPVRKIETEEFGFRSSQATRRRAASQHVQDESLMLTGDLNVLDVAWVVQFQIGDPVKFLFRVRNQRELIRDMSEAVMRRVVGDHSVDEVLSLMREEIDIEAQKNLQAILDNFESGISIVTVKLQDVTPPDRVKPAFNEVNEAKQEKERVVNEAWKAYNREIPKAKGEAEKRIREAEGYALDVVNRAKGEAERFVTVWEAYRQAPDITRKRLYLDTMAKVLPGVKTKYIIDSSQKSILPLLQLRSGEGS